MPPRDAAFDPYHLQRFVQAQAASYDRACSELRSGRKTSHWMWFVFPQIRGLGTSEMATRFAISGLDEAQAYLDHPLLGDRLIEATDLALAVAVRGRSTHEIFAPPDDLKFCSSMTLFAAAVAQRPMPSTGAPCFSAALTRMCGGSGCSRTLRLLGQKA